MNPPTELECGKRSLPTSPLSSPLPTSSLVTPVSLKALVDRSSPRHKKRNYRGPCRSPESSKRRRVAEPKEPEDTVIAGDYTPAGSANSETQIGENGAEMAVPGSATQEEPDDDWPAFLDFLNGTHRIVESTHQKMRQLSRDFDNMRSNHIEGVSLHESDRSPGVGIAAKEQTEGQTQVQAIAAEDEIHDM
ncbi:hypothetical protein HOY80DRAFT_1021577, partial [Tuber brumale]